MMPGKQQPPSLAIRLFNLCIPRPQRDIGLGDLLERFDENQSASWFWREVLTAIGIAMRTALRSHAMDLLFAVSGTALLELWWRTNFWRMSIWRGPAVESLFGWSAGLPFPVSEVCRLIVGAGIGTAHVVLLLAVLWSVERRSGWAAVRNGTIVAFLALTAGKLVTLTISNPYGFIEDGLFSLALTISAWYSHPPVSISPTDL